MPKRPLAPKYNQIFPLAGAGGALRLGGMLNDPKPQESLSERSGDQSIASASPSAPRDLSGSNSAIPAPESIAQNEPAKPESTSPLAPLPSSSPALEFTHDQFTFCQTIRKGNLAIHEQRKHGRIIAWEVVRIQSHKGYEAWGKKYPPAEYYPSSGQWGTDAFTCQSLEAAMKRMESMQSWPPTP